LEKISKVAYKLLLPYTCQLHPIFHVSQLKKHIGPKVVPTPDLPLVDEQGNIKLAPPEILERRMIPRNNEPVVQRLIQWTNLPASESTWEDASEECFHHSILEDKDVKGGPCQATSYLDVLFVSFVRRTHSNGTSGSRRLRAPLHRLLYARRFTIRRPAASDDALQRITFIFISVCYKL
jgi:hypothetical protein